MPFDIPHQDFKQCPFYGQCKYLNEYLFDQSPIPVVIVGLDGTFLKVNPSTQEFFGYTSSELENIKKFQDITHPEDLKADLEMMQRTIERHSLDDNYTMVKRYITKTGTVVWGKLDVKLVLDEQKKPYFFLSHITPLNVQVAFNGKTGKIPEQAKKSSELRDFIKANWKFLITWGGPIITAFIIWTYNSWAEYQLIKEKLRMVLENQQALKEEVVPKIKGDGN